MSKLLTTENNKKIAHVTVRINQYLYSNNKQGFQNINIERPLHLWGKQAQYLCESAKMSDKLVIEGRLGYSKGSDKTQFIDVKQLYIIKIKSE
jgi:hypothetical protein